MNEIMFFMALGTDGLYITLRVTQRPHEHLNNAEDNKLKRSGLGKQ